MLRPDRTALISDEYLAQQVAMHLHPEGYGRHGDRWADSVEWLARQFNCASVLDYGCGQGSLCRAIASPSLTCREYDPAIEGKTELPAFADLVVCTDVLEHVEMEKLPAVLQHIGRLARKLIFLVVHLQPAQKTLPDGRNAHITLRPSAWWEAQVDQQCWRLEDVPDLPVRGTLKPEKLWLGVARPS